MVMRIARHQAVFHVLSPIVPTDFPHIVTLCGSTRFRDEYEKALMAETLKGYLVFSVGLFGHEIQLDMEGDIKKMLDEIHLRKIDMSDEIVVVSRDGYIGQSTSNEIRYAITNNIPVRFVEPAAEQTWKRLQQLYDERAAKGATHAGY